MRWGIAKQYKLDFMKENIHKGETPCSILFKLCMIGQVEVKLCYCRLKPRVWKASTPSVMAEESYHSTGVHQAMVYIKADNEVLDEIFAVYIVILSII